MPQIPPSIPRTSTVQQSKRIDFTLLSLAGAAQWVKSSGLKQADFTSRSDPGKQVRIQATGVMLSFMRVRFQGRRYRIELGDLNSSTLDQIHQRYLDTRQAIAAGSDPRLLRRKIMTYDDFHTLHYRVVCQSRGKKSFITDDSRHLHWLKPEFGSLLITEIDVTKAAHFVTKLKAAGLAPATIKKTLVQLSGVLNMAVEMGFLSKNPIKLLKLPAVHNRRTEFMTVHDLAAFIHEARSCKDDEFVGSRMLMLAALTGARLGELTAAKHDHIDLDAGIWKLPTQKSGKPGVIQLSDSAKEIIREVVAVKTNDYLFPGCRGNAQLSRPIKLFKRICARAKLSSAPGIHGLRHGYCSAAVYAGIPIETVSHAARHSSPTVTRIYSHPHRESLAAANESVARLIMPPKIQKLSWTCPITGRVFP